MIPSIFGQDYFIISIFNAKAKIYYCVQKTILFKIKGFIKINKDK